MGGDDGLLEKLREIFGESVTIREKHGVGGGCINQTSLLVLDNGKRVFLKENSTAYPALFRTEAEGLAALASDDGPRVPQPYGYGEAGGRQFMVLEYIPEGRRKSDFWEDFGRRLARLHQTKRNKRFGFEGDNYIGATPQENGWEESWPEFFGRRRLAVQLELARKNGYGDQRWCRGLEQIIERLDQILPRPDQASLLHGDLWGGNFMVGSDGSAVLIDPAVSYGHREADLAMTELFGGFRPPFYASYNEVFPLDPGYEKRRDLYNLYHLLNHLNLFGGSYASSVASIVARYR